MQFDRKFFGSNAGPAQASRKQSTLSFSDDGSKKARPHADDENGGVDDTAGRNRGPKTPENKAVAEVRTQPPAMEQHDSDDADIKSGGVKSESSSPVPRKSKRNKSVVVEEDDDEPDEQPVIKRRRRSQSKAKAGSPKKNTPEAKKQPEAADAQTETNEIAEEKEAAAHDQAESSSGEQEEDVLSEDSEVEEPPPKQTKKQQAAAQKKEKVQDVLNSSGDDPYPDWKPGDPVPYAALCTTFSLVEMTTKRLAISSHCSLFLRQVLRLTPNDLLPTVQLMINKLAADYAGIELGIGESFIMKAIGESTGRSLAVIKADQHEIGDLGLVAAKSRGNQPTMFKPKPLTVRGVHEGLLAVAETQGHGSQDKKIAGIKRLLSAADTAVAGKGKVDITQNKGGASEAKFIVRFLEGKLRLGLAERTALVALAQAMVAHETGLKGNKAASAEQLTEGEAILKSVYRWVLRCRNFSCEGS